jgi:hypothetical protein
VCERDASVLPKTRTQFFVTTIGKTTTLPLVLTWLLPGT